MTAKKVTLALWGNPPSAVDVQQIEALGFKVICRQEAEEEDLGRDDIALVGIYLPEPERAYWAERGCAAQKWVLCQSPLLQSLRQTKVEWLDRPNTIERLVLTAPLLYTDWAKQILAACRNAALGPLVFVDLAVAVPQWQLADSGIGLVKGFCLDALALVSLIGGPIDSVYGRSRSLGLNRPQEDWAQGLIRFKNGVEGVCRFVGLDESDQIEIGLYGAGGSRVFKVGRQGLVDEGNTAQLIALGEQIKSGKSMAYGFTDYFAGLRLAEWLCQSARMDLELRYRDLNL